MGSCIEKHGLACSHPATSTSSFMTARCVDTKSHSLLLLPSRGSEIEGCRRHCSMLLREQRQGAELVGNLAEGLTESGGKSP